MSPRKTAKQRQEEAFNAEWNAERHFRRAISTLESLEDALAFTEAGPRLGEPGGDLYANFDAFLRYGRVPDSSWQRQLHAEFRQRMNAATHEE